MITIASPHHGTALASFGLGENARQMRRHSGFLRALAHAEGGQGPGVPFTSIYSTHDNLVAPQETSLLPWGRNVALGGIGHVDVLGSPALAGLILADLRAGAHCPGRLEKGLQGSGDAPMEGRRGRAGRKRDPGARRLALRPAGSLARGTERVLDEKGALQRSGQDWVWRWREAALSSSRGLRSSR